MVDEQKLREVAQAAINGDDCAYDILCDDLGSGVVVLSLLDELQTLREERTAWRVTAENAEKDAARYRWILKQDFNDRQWHDSFEEYEKERAERIDAAIDAAMKEES